LASVFGTAMTVVMVAAFAAPLNAAATAGAGPAATLLHALGTIGAFLALLPAELHAPVVAVVATLRPIAAALFASDDLAATLLVTPLNTMPTVFLGAFDPHTAPAISIAIPGPATIVAIPIGIDREGDDGEA